MQTYYVTFGYAHAHHINGYTFDHDSVGTILAEDYAQARARCFEAFGPKFCFLQEKEPPMKYFPRGLHPLEGNQRRCEMTDAPEKECEMTDATEEDCEWMHEARELAAQCWCDPETADRIMDPTLCEAFAKRLAIWMQAAAQAQDKNC